MKKEFEKGLKRFLKRKVKITMGIIVSFMIIGNNVWANNHNDFFYVGRVGSSYYFKDDGYGPIEKGSLAGESDKVIENEDNITIDMNSLVKQDDKTGKGVTLTLGSYLYEDKNITINFHNNAIFDGGSTSTTGASSFQVGNSGPDKISDNLTINMDNGKTISFIGGSSTTYNEDPVFKMEQKSEVNINGGILYIENIAPKSPSNGGKAVHIKGNSNLIVDNESVRINKSFNRPDDFLDDWEDIGILLENSSANFTTNNSFYIGSKDTKKYESFAYGILSENSETTINSGLISISASKNAISSYGKSNVNLTSDEEITLISTDDDETKESETSTIYAESNPKGDAIINLTSENGVVNILSDNKSVWASGDGGTININGAVNIDSRYVENGTDKLSNDGQHIAVVAGVVGKDTDLSKHGEVNITLKGDKDSLINGDIVGARDGIVNITQDNYSGRLKIKGDILAGNGRYSEEQGKQLGVVNVDLGKNGYFEGCTDDYKDLKYKNDNDSGFYDPHFSNGEVTSAGQVNINMGEDSYWNVTGQSWVTKLEGNGTIDLRGEETGGHAIHIGTLDGENKFVINLNPEDVSSGDMIFIENGTDKKQTILVSNEEDLIKLQEGQRIRFATIADAKGGFEYGGAFGDTYTIKEKGLRNVDLNVKYVDMDKEDEAEKEYTNVGTYEEYNGNKFDETKPGTDYVDDVYNKIDEDKNSQNVYFVRGENSGGGDENINDIGTTIIEMTKANYNSAVYMDNLNKRLGDMTFANGSDGVWVRMRNDRVGEDEVYRLHNYMTQVGYDKVYGMKNGNEHRGIAFEYTRGNMDYKDIQGESNIDKYMISLYDTRLYNNGAYSDIVAKVGYMESDFEIYGRETGVKVTGDYDNLIFGLSGEFGKRFDFSDNYYFEPQVQLQYTYIDDTDYTTHVGDLDTKVNYGDINSLIGRAGFRLGHDFYNENSKDNTVYLKADVNHEFLGEQDIEAKDLTGTLNKTYHNDKSWFDVGIGGAKNLTEDLNVYADIERQFGEAKDNSWQFNLGFRYSFNSVKDITLSVSSLFDFDKSELKSEAKTMIQEKSKGLNNKKVKGTLNIEGHTDSIGTREYNQKLSEKRADAVTEEFKKNVTNENINYETKGYGEDRPIADNNTKEGRAKNRRVEVRYSK